MLQSIKPESVIDSNPTSISYLDQDGAYTFRVDPKEISKTLGIAPNKFRPLQLEVPEQRKIFELNSLKTLALSRIDRLELLPIEQRPNNYEDLMQEAEKLLKATKSVKKDVDTDSPFGGLTETLDQVFRLSQHPLVSSKTKQSIERMKHNFV